MFLAFRSAVADAVEAALDRLGYPTDDLGIERPPEGIDAVLASSAAFRLAGAAEAPPPEVAAEVADAVETDAEYVGDVWAQGPYVNVSPAEAYYEDTVAAAGEAGWGWLPDTGESVVVEHTSANPTGPVHVGRARNPIVGDALARILDRAGHDVATHYYVNDAGRQVAVFTWAYETFDEDDLPEPERERPDYELVRYYRTGTEFLEEADPAEVAAAEDEIDAILRGLEAGDPEAYERVHAVVDDVLAGMRASLERLPAAFDEFVEETRFMRDGATDDVVARLKQLEASKLEEDAWQLDLSAEGIEKELVFVRSDGTSLYATRDLAHHEWKLEEFDRAVTVLGEDHKLQAEQVRAALDLLGADADRVDPVHYSWVNLPEGGMSTREGTGVDLDDLLDEAIERARDEVEKRLDDRTRGDLDEADVERIAEQVGVGAVRYDIVATQPSKSITFEWEDALDFEAQSAPYCQYAHARACGILEGADDEPGLDATIEAPAAHELVRTVARFPATVEAAAGSLEPHAVATYARELADAFNAFYRECPVLDAPADVRATRLALVVAARETLAAALDALGIAAPESM
jgi:arginyl-tRNA synthetase